MFYNDAQKQQQYIINRYDNVVSNKCKQIYFTLIDLTQRELCKLLCSLALKFGIGTNNDFFKN